MITWSDLAPGDAEVFAAIGVHLAWHERLFAFVVGDNCAAALVDTNADGREIVLTRWVKLPTGTWVCIADQDDVGDPGMGELTGYGWAVGRSRGAQVTIADGDTCRQVPTRAHGWWVYVNPVGPSDDFARRVR